MTDLAMFGDDDFFEYLYEKTLDDQRDYRSKLRYTNSYSLGR
jgi:hypothetical protein